MSRTTPSRAPARVRTRVRHGAIGVVLLQALALLVGFTAAVGSVSPTPAGATDPIDVEHPHSGQPWRNAYPDGRPGNYWDRMERQHANRGTFYAPPEDQAGCAGTVTNWAPMPWSHPSRINSSTNPRMGENDQARVCYRQLPGRVVVDWIEGAQLQWGCNDDTMTQFFLQGINWLGFDPSSAGWAEWINLVTSVMASAGRPCIQTDSSVLHGIAYTTWSGHIDYVGGGTSTLHQESRTVPAIYCATCDENGYDTQAGDEYYYWGIHRMNVNGAQLTKTAGTVWVEQADYTAVGAAGNVIRYTKDPNWLGINISTYLPVGDAISGAVVQQPSAPTPNPVGSAVVYGTTGSPIGGAVVQDVAPTGTLQSVSFVPGSYAVNVSGVATDGNASGGLTVPLWSPGRNAWVGFATTSSSGAFSTMVGMPSNLGDYSICAAVHNYGSAGHSLDRWLVPSCANPNHAPTGHLDTAEYTGAGFDARFTGWAQDPDFASQGLRVDLVTDDQVNHGTTIATVSRADVGSHGFDVTIPIPFAYAGMRLCAVARDLGGRNHVNIGCLVPLSIPFGRFDDLRRVGLNRYQATGWAVQPTAPVASQINFTLDGVGLAWPSTANTPRPDVANAYPGLDQGHGFDRTFSIAPGTHTLCATAANVMVYAGRSTSLGCRTVLNDDPVGTLDSATRYDPTTYDIAGWSIDPDSNGITDVHVYVDPHTANEIRYTFPGAANINRPDLAAANNDPSVSSLNWVYGGGHGYNVRITGVPLGQHDICAYGINLAAGHNELLGCKRVGTPALSSPVGAIDKVLGPQWVNGAPAIRIQGWAVDPDTTWPIPLDAYWDPNTPQSTGYTLTTAAWSDRPGVPAPMPGYGRPHWYDNTIPIPTTPGDHQLCVMGINVGPGGNAPVQCVTVTSTGHDPFGSLDDVSGLRWNGTAPEYVVSGFSIDPDTNAPTTVDIYWDPNTPQSKGYPGLTATVERRDAGAAYVGYGDYHGYSVSVPPPAAAGTHQLCAYGINTGPGGNRPLGCKTVVSSGHDPTGSLDKVEPGFNGSAGIHVAGWMVDPDLATAGQVHIYVDGVGKAIINPANTSRADVASSLAGYGSAHGFDTIIGGIAPGAHTVCAYGINVGTGNTNTTLGCKPVTVSSTATGSFDLIGIGYAGGTGIHVAGWALDPDTAAAVQVHVYVDGVGTPIVANTSRTDIGAAMPGYGNNHGFDAVVPAAVGTHNVCTYAIGVTASGATDGNNTTLSCKTITVGSDAIGSFDSATANGGGAVTVKGWAIDPDTVAATAVHIYVDGVGTAIIDPASTTRSDLAAAAPGYGTAHGFDQKLTGLATGTRSICAYAINRPGTPGGNQLLTCTSVTVT